MAGGSGRIIGVIFFFFAVFSPENTSCFARPKQRH